MEKVRRFGIMRRIEKLMSQAYTIILDRGEEGILQSELWKELDASSREGSTVASKLEEQNLIQRERELSEGHWTYRLYSMKEPTTLSSILDIPCTTCPVILRCGSGNTVSPERCRKIELWLADKVR